jgi:hypothetical protein
LIRGRRVIEQLQANNVHTIAVANPLLAGIGAPVILVGHFFRGFVCVVRSAGIVVRQVPVLRHVPCRADQ